MCEGKVLADVLEINQCDRELFSKIMFNESQDELMMPHSCMVCLKTVCLYRKRNLSEQLE